MWTSDFWPIRWTRWMACSSTAGFHHKSSRYSRVAAVRFNPTPPAFREMSNTRPAPDPHDASSLSHATRFCLSSRLREPSKRWQGICAASTAAPTRSRKEVHWEKTTARLPASMSSCSSFMSSLIFVLCAASAQPSLPFSLPEARARSREGKREAPGRTFSDLRLRAPGWRHTGHSPFHSSMALIAQSRQKMWPQGVMAGSSGVSTQMGQSGSAPCRSSSKRLATNFWDLPPSRDISLRQRCSSPWKSASAAPSRANTRKGWQSACRSLRMSCKMCVYFAKASPRATKVSNCVFALL
mmetsp:Transcript_14865/g.44444  ORF Transcript_14865/g.44444 Transcript_14865/m.44444 type:complete len:297 (+) Transcript_14865:1298-2188(+)